MNYRNAALAEFKALASETEEYIENNIEKTMTIGQVFLAVIKNKPEGVNLNEWLRDISDEEMYTIIENTKLKERP